MHACRTPTLLMDMAAHWEIDFITREVVPAGTDVQPFNKNNTAALRGRDPAHGLIIAFSSNVHSYELMARICTELKPQICLHLSDEYYPGYKGAYNELASHSSLYLRQHKLPNYRYLHNTAFLGLGYGSGMLDPLERSDNLSIRAMNTRSRPWAFVGSIKQDRAEMLQAFELIPGGLAVTDRIPIREMRTIYENSIFAPVGRGNVALECFRIYESIIVGCIPVVVGSDRMIHETLTHIGRPPYILANSWEAAVQRCRTLLDDPVRLEARQSACLDYWRQHVRSIRDLCAFHLSPGTTG